MKPTDEERLKFWYGANNTGGSSAPNASGTKSGSLLPESKSLSQAQEVIDFSGKPTTGGSSPRLSGTLRLPKKSAKRTR